MPDYQLLKVEENITRQCVDTAIGKRKKKRNPGELRLYKQRMFQWNKYKLSLERIPVRMSSELAKKKNSFQHYNGHIFVLLALRQSQIC